MSRNPILWKPTQEQIEKTQLESFRKQVNMRFNIDIKNYADLHKWSINNIEDIFLNICVISIGVCGYFHKRKFMLLSVATTYQLGVTPLSHAMLQL